MAEYYHLARPYAKAAFEYANENDFLDAWMILLQNVEKAINCDVVKAYINHPKVTQAQVVSLVVDALSIKDSAFINLLKLMAQNKRLIIIASVAELFAQLKAKQAGVVYASMTSAYTISKEIKTKIAKSLSHKFALEVVLETKVDPSLIGGAVIQVGDLVIDGSILGNFNRLKQELLA